MNNPDPRHQPIMSIPAQRRALRAEIKERRREVIPALKKSLAEAKRVRGKRITSCKLEMRKAIEANRTRAIKAMAKLKEAIKRTEKRARELAKACKREQKAAAVQSVEKALLALDDERKKIAELTKQARLIRSERGRAGGLKAAERRAESDDEVKRNLEDPYMIDLWEKVKHKIKASRLRSRTEAFLEYVHDQPEALDELRHEKEIEYEKELEKELEERKGIKGYELELEACQREVQKLRSAATLAQIPF